MERTVSRRTTFNQALADYELMLRECTTTAVDGRSFVLVQKLQTWMRSTNTSNRLDNKFVTNTDLLAHAAYSGNSDFLPVEPSAVADVGPECCLVVFCILLELGLGHLLHLLCRAGIVDNQLPVPSSILKKNLSRVALEDRDQVVELFDQRQWKFCPALFSLHMDKQFYENRIIPVCRTQDINAGGTANVTQIVVQAEFVDQKLRTMLEDDEHASYQDKDYDGYFQYFEDEKKAFDGLRLIPGVIRRLGCYSHRSPVVPQNPSTQGTTTMNLLLEYGTYDLRLIFGHLTPPVFPTETIAFWENLFGVANAVSGIHEFKHGGSDFNGWHADIKPENIIFVRGKYKLADPGFACFKKKKAQESGTSPRICLHGGTSTYGAPEVYGTNVDQTIDVWSLACVFSMAATWVVLGFQGVCQYQLVREKALEGLLGTIKDDSHPLLQFLQVPAHAKPCKVDCFHNGTEILPEVAGWHSLLKSSSRRTDPITAALVDLIGNRMLVKDPVERITSRDLCTELRKLVASAKRTMTKVHADETLEARTQRQHMEILLKGIDKDAAPEATEEQQPMRALAPAFVSGLPVNRSALKAHISNLALKKTSHRFRTIPESHSGPTSLGTDKFGVSLGKKKLTKDEFLSKHFNERDIIFLVDDAESMHDHWDATTYLLETLVLKAHDQDPDGPDLIFTNDTQPRKEKNAAEFRKAMEDVRPHRGVHTNIKVSMEKIFHDYISRARDTRKKNSVKALTVIVLTDGLWKGMDDRDEIITEIVQFYKKLEVAMDNGVRHRQVSIQFIQLGDDDEARERLRRLDDDTPYRGIPDIIDYEKFTLGGDIDKMLLGSFVEEMDARNSDDESHPSPARSPGSPPANGVPLRPINETLNDRVSSPTAQRFELPVSRPTR
ncbi:hypothetical protein N0V86_005286 [Didymella sp. IMI 355093]|nr:hypothetical protein N0V86_005286 [Didymella sp. IMI 355093]